MNIFTPTSAHTPTHSIDRENHGVMMNCFTPSLPQSSPFHRLPGVSGKIVRDLTACGGVNAEVVGFELTAIMSLLTQGGAYVVWPNGQNLPNGANVWLSTPSRSGSTFILQTLMRPIEQDLAVRMSTNSVSQHDDFLIDGDETYSAIARILHKHPIAGYFTGEPGQLKRMLKNASQWSKILDGTSLPTARSSGKRVESCLTIFLTDEPDVSDAKILREAVKKGGAGFMNHFFLALLNDLHVEGPLHRVGLSTKVAQTYRKIVKERLDVIFKQVNLGKTHERPTLTLSPEASEYLDHIDHEVRSNCGPRARWTLVPEYGTGHIERISRFAGSIHVFEHGVEGEISLDTLQCADAIGKWCVDSVARAIYEPPKLTLAQIDAAALEKGLINLYFSEARTQFLKSDIRTHALGLGLMSARFNRALAVLGEQGKVRTFPHLNNAWVEILCGPEFSRTPHYLRIVPGSFA